MARVTGSSGVNVSVLEQSSVLFRCRGLRDPAGMATLVQKIETETRMRKLLEDSGLPQPDHVEYGFTCIRLFFKESMTVVVVDIDEPEEVTPDIETDAA